MWSILCWLINGDKVISECLLGKYCLYLMYLNVLLYVFFCIVCIMKSFVSLYVVIELIIVFDLFINR